MLLNQSLEDSKHSSQIATVTLLDEWLFLALTNLTGFFKKWYLMAYTEIVWGNSGGLHSHFMKINSQHTLENVFSQF